MTNYNDGKWWGWNGGECPVHPETEVEAVCAIPSGFSRASWKLAGDIDWQGGIPSEVISFRVIKEYRAPREWWIYESNNGSTFICLSETDARCRESAYGGRSIRVREVLPD